MVTEAAGTSLLSQRLPAWMQSRSPLVRLAPTLIALVVAIIAVTIYNPNFMSGANLSRLAASSAIPLLLAVGVTFVILMGSIDLSIEGVLALSATTTVLVLQIDPGPTGSIIALVVAVLTGAATGTVTGLLHTVLKIPSFMVTLGMWFVSAGFATLLLGGGTIAVRSADLRVLIMNRFLGLPLTVWVTLVVVLIAIVMHSRTRFGRHVMAIGGEESIAQLAGLPIKRTRAAVFAIAGGFYGLAAALAVAQLGQGNVDIGEGRLFTTITAVVLGGTALSGGVGGVVNAILGVLLVVVLTNGMILMGVPPYLQQAVLGVLIIIAVASSTARKREGICK
ncbi:ribose transport system permease protein [Cohaesibacter sp. ES.047]|uniref:ABC transporter permease n=1 Tax=Cohaesibacter sp. ES.047 TaxID=1798205 RepID=UPI000BBF5384|nr:ABC transporter permease [Cohaesibacter sp. ES.047]SNY91028.1 ribose transport system permease protein [Cohaesibacter sp. ES.047]